MSGEVALPTGTRPGPVHLRVVDPEPLLAFYGDLLGLEPMDEGDDELIAREGARTVTGLRAPGGVEALVVLHAHPDAPPRPPGVPGLFHLALRLPTRADLGAVFLRLRERGGPLQGASDHAVSEALYLADPEGNGIELYADRPAETWPRPGGRLGLTTEPLDIRSLLAAANASSALPAGTVMGHVHLQVGDLEAAREFYGATGLGFELTVGHYPGALFFAAGGYHHHLGVNTWGVARPAPKDLRGLLAWTLAIPDEAAAAAAAERVGAEAVGEAWRVDDPSGNRLLLTTALRSG